MAIQGWAVADLTVLFSTVITRPPLAGRSELIRSTCKSCHVCAGSISERRKQVADPGFAKGEGGERTVATAKRKPEYGSGGGAPSGVQGLSPWWEIEGAES